MGGLAATASRLLAKYGERVVLSYMTGGGVDPATGEITSPATRMTLDAYGYPSKYDKSEVDGTVIRSDDTRLVLEKITERPQVGWSALVDSKQLRIMDVLPVRRSADDVIYIAQCRTQ